MSNSNKQDHKRSRRLIVSTIAVAGLLTLAATSGARAITPNVMSEVRHFIECFGWMLTDPDTHSQNCLPSNEPPAFESLASQGGDGVAAPPAPPPPDDSVDDSVITPPPDTYITPPIYE